MNAQSALALARRIFKTDRAMVFSGRCEERTHRTGRAMCSAPDAHGQRCKGHRPFAQVGTWELASFFSVKGAGRTWDEAFARARFKVHRDDCRRWLVRGKCGSCLSLGGLSR